MTRFFIITLATISFFINTNAFAFNNIEEEKYMLNYSINNNFEKSVSFKYSEKNIDNSNLQARSINENKVTELNYSGYRNVQGSKSNRNKSNSKKFASIAIGVIITGVALIGVTIGAIINSL
jgi:hypothetical protein